MAEPTIPEPAPGADAVAETEPRRPSRIDGLGLWPAVVLLTLGRVLVFAVLVALLWLAGLGSFPGLLFALLLSMPVSYVLLKPLRDKVTTELVVHTDARRERKAQLRADLRGDGEG